MASGLSPPCAHQHVRRRQRPLNRLGRPRQAAPV